MEKTIVTMGVAYAQLLNDLREVVRQEVAQVSSQQADAPAVGGIDLACEVTRLSKPMLYALVSERAIPHMKRGNRLTFSRAELMDWMKAGKRAERALI